MVVRPPVRRVFVIVRTRAKVRRLTPAVLGRPTRTKTYFFAKQLSPEGLGNTANANHLILKKNVVNDISGHISILV